MTDAPLVSLCIPTFRGEAFIAATIRSVLAQSHRDLELWVVDDASPDDTAGVVRAIEDPRVRYVRNDTNLGPLANWNRCLALARGKYYKLLPHDDLLEADSLATQVAILEADVDQRIALVFGSRLVIDDRDRPVIQRAPFGLAEGRIPAARLVRRCVRAGANLIGEPGNGLIRRSLVERIGRYDMVHPYLVDLDYWIRALRFGDGYYTASRTSRFRMSPGSWSVTLARRQYLDWKGFVASVAREPAFGVTRTDARIGFAKARVNTAARALLYRLLWKTRRWHAHP